MGRVTLAALLFAGGSAAATLNPSEAEIAAELEVGAALVSPDKGYPLKDNVLYEVPDARDIKAEWGDVDAVILATPLERARHAAYIAKLSGQSIDAARAQQLPELRPRAVSIIVYAHGPDANDESFIEKFGGVSLIIARQTIAAADFTHSDLSRATYPLAGVQRMRKVAVLTFRFDLTAVPGRDKARCHLKFTDPTGKMFDIPLDLAQYR